MVDRLTRFRTYLVCGLLVGVPGAAFAAGDEVAGMHGTMNPNGGAADKQMMSGMARMQEEMKQAPMDGNPDHDFVSMMTPHHQGAIDMAEVELKYGKDPELRRLAGEIIDAQHREIAQMHDWMAAHARQD